MASVQVPCITRVIAPWGQSLGLPEWPDWSLTAAGSVVHSGWTDRK